MRIPALFFLVQYFGFLADLLKNSEMLPQKNSRKGELIADFGRRCRSEHVRRPLNESAQVEAVLHVTKRRAHQRLLENFPNAGEDFFNTNRPGADILSDPVDIGDT